MIKKLGHNKFDVFFGIGWEQWVRMEKKGSKWEATAGDVSLEKGASVFLERKFK